jgi:hypothetical protein
MIKGLSKLSLTELEGDMVDIEIMVKNLIIGEPGGCTGMYNIIDLEDVVMVDTAESYTSDIVIRWADEQMDTRVLGTNVNKEYRMQDDLEMAHTDTEEVTNMDTLTEVVVMLPEEEEGKEMVPGVVGDSQSSEMEVWWEWRDSLCIHTNTVVCTHRCSDQLPLPKMVCSWAV